MSRRSGSEAASPFGTPWRWPDACTLTSRRSDSCPCHYGTGYPLVYNIKHTGFSVRPMCFGSTMMKGLNCSSRSHVGCGATGCSNGTPASSSSCIVPPSAASAPSSSTSSSSASSATLSSQAASSTAPSTPTLPSSPPSSPSLPTPTPSPSTPPSPSPPTHSPSIPKCSPPRPSRLPHLLFLAQHHHRRRRHQVAPRTRPPPRILARPLRADRPAHRLLPTRLRRPRPAGVRQNAAQGRRLLDCALSGLAALGCPATVLRVFASMRSHAAPNAATVVFAVSASAGLESLALVRCLHAYVEKAGFGGRVSVRNSLALARCLHAYVEKAGFVFVPLWHGLSTSI
ncbi:putative glycine-rich RNA-binding protein 2 [Iris pallida]|uniref:Glycine-rich RNA-binding protein 2 n=1 Tax=Iris pallida TaxID=29817 RepID=A0AAX6GVS9_IRIPA|nr:putative glycine-rich RNA-binding protein 2 [Iris pallida]